ncbi:unnamed protein product [Closterium sp. NIES-65]|nr:unnamed protein product [Closterium sp. NIES-65]
MRHAPTIVMLLLLCAFLLAAQPSSASRASWRHLNRAWWNGGENAHLAAPSCGNSGNFSAPAPVYIVRLRSAPPLSEYRGGIAGYPATATWDDGSDEEDSDAVPLMILPTGNSAAAASGESVDLDDTDGDHLLPNATVPAPNPNATFEVAVGTPSARGGRGGNGDGNGGSNGGCGCPWHRLSLSMDRPQVVAFAALLQRQQAQVASEAGVPDDGLLYNYKHTSNGFAARLTPRQLWRLRRHPTVASVRASRVFRQETIDSPQFLGLPGKVWPAMDGQSKAGEGTVVGIVDTGIWPKHPSFSDKGLSSQLPAGWKGNISGKAPQGVKVTVSSKTLTLAPGEKATYTLTVTVDTPSNDFNQLAPVVTSRAPHPGAPIGAHHLPREQWKEPTSGALREREDDNDEAAGESVFPGGAIRMHVVAMEKWKESTSGALRKLPYLSPLPLPLSLPPFPPSLPIRPPPYPLILPTFLSRHPTPSPNMFESLLRTAEAVGIAVDTSSSKNLADSLDRAMAVGVAVDTSSFKNLAGSLDQAVGPDLYFKKLIRSLTARPAKTSVASSQDSFPPLGPVVCLAPGPDPCFNKLIRILTSRCMTQPTPSLPYPCPCLSSYRSTSSQAVYFPSGQLAPAKYHHYGLAVPIYTHFTLPIRRYADVVVHRLLAAAIGWTPLPDQTKDKTALTDNLNYRNRNAHMAGRASVELHTLIFFRTR